MKKTIIYLVIILILAVGGYVFYYFSPKEPNVVVKSFYENFLEGDDEFEKLATDEFVKIAQTERGKVLCGLQNPESVNVVTTDKSMSTSSVKANFLFEDQIYSANVELVKDGNNKWIISGIDCFNAEEEGLTSFEKEGSVLEGDDGELVFEYEEGGSLEIISLEITDESKCIEGGISTLCFSGSLQEGMRVVIKGDIQGEVLKVNEIRFKGSEILEGVVLSKNPGEREIVFLIGGGIEAITASINQFTEIYDESLSVISYEDILVGDSISIRGSIKSDRLVANEIRVTKSSAIESSSEEER